MDLENQSPEGFINGWWADSECILQVENKIIFSSLEFKVRKLTRTGRTEAESSEKAVFGLSGKDPLGDFPF